jgi:hypothetical protein
MEIIETRYCSVCDRDVSIDQFYRRKSGRNAGQLINPCKSCNIVKAAKWAKDNREHRRRHCLKYDDAHREKIRDWHRKNRAGKTQEQRRAPHLKRMYGMTPEQYSELLLKQGGTCALCPARTGKASGGYLFVDHDHRTGNVRGLLCVSCNTALGLLGDDPEHLTRALRYLQSNALSSVLAGA